MAGETLPHQWQISYYFFHFGGGDTTLRRSVFEWQAAKWKNKQTLSFPHTMMWLMIMMIMMMMLSMMMMMMTMMVVRIVHMSRQPGNLAVKGTAVHTTSIITVQALQFKQMH